MKLSKPGLVFLVLYLLWAGFWYYGYRVCPPYSGSGLMGIYLGDPCENTLSVVALPVGLVLWWIMKFVDPSLTSTTEGHHLFILVTFVVSCAVFYGLGALMDGRWRRS